MFHHWVCTTIYRQLSYPFTSLYSLCYFLNDKYLQFSKQPIKFLAIYLPTPCFFSITYPWNRFFNGQKTVYFIYLFQLILILAWILQSSFWKNDKYKILKSSGISIKFDSYHQKNAGSGPRGIVLFENCIKKFSKK